MPLCPNASLVAQCRPLHLSSMPQCLSSILLECCRAQERIANEMFQRDTPGYGLKQCQTCSAQIPSSAATCGECGVHATNLGAVGNGRPRASNTSAANLQAQQAFAASYDAGVHATPCATFASAVCATFASAVCATFASVVCYICLSCPCYLLAACATFTSTASATFTSTASATFTQLPVQIGITLWLKFWNK